MRTGIFPSYDSTMKFIDDGDSLGEWLDWDDMTFHCDNCRHGESYHLSGKCVKRKPLVAEMGFWNLFGLAAIKTGKCGCEHYISSKDLDIAKKLKQQNYPKVTRE